jgi:hypothetical protein
MADPAVTLDRLEALEITTNIPAQVTLYEDAFLDDGFGNFVQLFLVQVLGTDIRIQTGILDQAISNSWPNSVDITEGIWELFVPGNFDTQ